MRHQDGIVFHAGAGIVALNTEPLTGRWVAATTRASSALKSAAKTP